MNATAFAIVVGLAVPSTASAQAPTLDGAWDMTFTPTSSIGGYAKLKPYQREWIFELVDSRLYVWRETTDGYIRLRVRRNGPVYVVKRTMRVPCSKTDSSFRYSERISFTLRRDAITGRLVGRSPADICGKNVRASVAKDRITGLRQEIEG